MTSRFGELEARFGRGVPGAALPDIDREMGDLGLRFVPRLKLPERRIVWGVQAGSTSYFTVIETPDGTLSLLDARDQW